MNLPGEKTMMSETSGVVDCGKHTDRLDIVVNIAVTGTCVILFIVSHVVNLVLLDEGLINHPGCLCNDFVNPSTMPHSF
jgi:hypothetical protein